MRSVFCFSRVFITGLAVSQVASILARQGKSVTQMESFAYRFALAFGIALMRYFLVTRWVSVYSTTARRACMSTCKSTIGSPLGSAGLHTFIEHGG